MKHLPHITNAGQLITTHVPTVHRSETVGTVLGSLSRQKNIETFNYVYVVDNDQHLVGVVSLKELYQADNAVPIHNIVKREVITARPITTPERAAYLALKHNIKAVPIVDKKGIFLGVLASDTILHTLYQDVHHDLLRISGIIPNQSFLSSFSSSTVWQSLRSRSPWIGIGLIGGTMIAQFLSHFEQALVTEALFIPFIPMVVYIANAVGVQSQTLYIREETLDEGIDIWKFLQRQLLEGFAIGLLTWGCMIVLTTILWSTVQLGFVVGFAMLISVVLSVLQAVLIPYGLVKLKKDPAIGSGPFATIMQDFTSVVIFIFTILLLAPSS